MVPQPDGQPQAAEHRNHEKNESFYHWKDKNIPLLAPVASGRSPRTSVEARRPVVATAGSGRRRSSACYTFCFQNINWYVSSA
jgi:hypothetical protein